MYRTGKSYLLNRVILNVQKGDGFGVGPTINPCTKGLWMWAQPLIGYTDTGEKIKRVGRRTARATAHADFVRQWTGSTRFLLRTSEPWRI